MIRLHLHFHHLYHHLVFLLLFVKEALSLSKWWAALNAEMFALHENGTWELDHFSSEKSTVRCHWVFTVKYHLDGTIDWYKARLIAKDYTQTYGVDYAKNFSLVRKALYGLKQSP